MKKILISLIVGITSVFSINSIYAAAKVDLVYSEWSTNVASINVVKIVLETMGYDVNLFSVDPETLWRAVAEGNVDGMVSAWVPHRLLTELKEQVDDLGPNLENVKVGLVVPKYVPIDSIAELQFHAEKFGNKIISIEPETDLVQKTNQAISTYGLEPFKLMVGDEEIMINILEAAINNNQWVVVTGWTPHLKFSWWDLKYLDDSKKVYAGGLEQVNTIVRQGLREDLPEVHKILDNFYWTTADMEQVMLWNHEPDADPYQNAKRWVQENQEKVRKWTEKILVIQSATYNTDTGELHIPVVEVLSEGQRITTMSSDMQLVSDSIDTATALFELEHDQLVPLSTLPIGYSSVLKRISERGKLICGIRKTQMRGFAYLDEQGHYDGFDVILCRAVAVAILNDPEAVDFTPLISKQRGEALRSGQIDMLSGNTSWTASREAQWGDFIWIMFYDGQGFMVKESSGITRFEQLDGKSVCVTRGTTAELNLKNAFTQRGLAVMPIVMESTPVAYEAYKNGECTAFTNGKSQLAEIRYNSDNPSTHIILDITVSKEPLTPVVPHGDSQWTDIVKTIMFALINAEELNITQTNVEKMVNSIDPQVKILLGVEGAFGQSELGLKADVVARVIKAVGNYGEIYERYFGADSIGIPRGLNHLWRDGGLMYAPPLR